MNNEPTSRPLASCTSPHALGKSARAYVLGLAALCCASLLGCGSSPTSTDESDVSAFEPDAGRDAARLPDASADASLDTFLPDVTTPDGTTPDGTTPDATLPDATLPDATTPDATLPDVISGTAAMGCDAPEVAWAVEDELWWLDVGFVGLSPDNGLVLRGQMIQESLVVLRSSDGARLGVRTHDQVVDLSVDGSIEVARMDQEFVIRDRATGEVLSEARRTDDQYGIKRVELSPSGAMVGVLECLPEQQGVALRAVTARGDVLRTWTLPPETDWGCIGWADHNAYAMDVSESYIVAALPQSGAVAVFDIATGDSRDLDAHAAQENENFQFHPPVVDVQIRPDETEFATSGRDGRVQRWAMNTLQPIGDALTTSPIRLNVQTFTNGFYAAPVSYSPNGAAFAYVNAAGSVVVTDLLTGLDVATVPRASEWVEPFPTGEATVGVAALGFSADSRALVIVETSATQLLSCGLQVSDRESPALSLELAEPDPSNNWPLTVDAVSATGYGALDLTIDGVQGWLQPGSRDQYVSLREPGEHEVVITLSDGLSAVSETLIVTVP